MDTRFLSRCGAMLGLMCVLASACVSGPRPALAAPPIQPLKISVTPSTLELAPGASATIAAHASGGEALRLIIEWTLEEGNKGGSITPLGERSNGEASARYTAPAAGGGPFHVSAHIRGFPAVKATATITQGR